MAMVFRAMRRRLSILVLAVVLLLLFLVIRNPYRITDWFKLRDYQPTADITAIGDATTMTDKARHLFYINHPELQDKAAFRQSCPQYDEQTIVIGCYDAGQRGIFVLKVDDERLNGVEEVTAAHEMLHAAYERLSDSERARIDALLQDYANTQLKNQRILTTLEGYKKSEPGQQLNEMHSMFGTEIDDLPTELKAYYSQYFQDRSRVVAAADAYQAAFTSRQATIEQYDSQLKQLNTKIKADTQSLETQADDIDRSRKQLESYRQGGNIDSYNNGVEPFNARVNAYNALLEATRQEISQYNTLVGERNAIAAQTLELQKAIDSSSLPQSQ
jgi:uncharacterized protein YukE